MCTAAESVSVIAIGRLVFHSTIALELRNTQSFDKSVPAELMFQTIEFNKVNLYALDLKGPLTVD